MNIYFIYLKDFDPSNFKNLLEMLKVKEVINLIPVNNDINPEAYVKEEVPVEPYIFSKIKPPSVLETYHDLSYLKQKPQKQYLSQLAKEIIKIIEFQETLSFYYEARDCGLDVEPPYAHSNACDIIGNINGSDSFNFMVFCCDGLDLCGLIFDIYGEMYNSTHSFDFEDKIPMILIHSWAQNPERNIISVWKRIRRTDKMNVNCINEIRPLTFDEKRKFSCGVFFPITMDEMEGDKKLLYYGNHYDPLCYLYKEYVESQIDDEMELKIGLANLILTEEAQRKMNERLEELAEERREMEYQEWLHPLEIDDRDYERETYEVLGGDDYD